MSRRMKFALLVWVGPGVSAMKKAKLSTDKGFVKQVFVVSIALFHSSGLSHTWNNPFVFKGLPVKSTIKLEMVFMKHYALYDLLVNKDGTLHF